MLNTKKLIIVDDHQLYRTGIRSFLSKASSIQIIGEAACSRELFQLLQKNRIPDIVLLDILLPGETGVDIARILRAHYPQIKIIMLSSETSEEIITELSEIGIDGFVSKSSQREELLNAIKSVMQDTPYFGKDIACILYDLYINHVGTSAHEKNETSKESLLFTDKELDVIRLCGEGLRTKEIADKLCVSSRTVESHRRNIFKKLNINNSVELLKYGIRSGIIQL